MTTPLDRSTLESLIVQKATKDPVFREQLTADPLHAISHAFQITLPPTLAISVIEETPTRLCLVLPATEPQGELNDSDLAGIAGGVHDPNEPSNKEPYPG